MKCFDSAIGNLKILARMKKSFCKTKIYKDKTIILKPTFFLMNELIIKLCYDRSSTNSRNRDVQTGTLR